MRVLTRPCRHGSLYLLLLLTVIACCGCTGIGSRVPGSSAGIRQDVFQEATESTPPPGTLLLEVEFSVKANRGRFITTCYKHTDPPLTVSMAIDGQVADLADDPFLEETPGDSRDNPDAGAGWRYRFKKKILLAPGVHQIDISLPLHGISMKKTIELERKLNYLKIEPIYNTSLGRDRHIPKFSNGVRGLALRLNQRDQ